MRFFAITDATQTTTNRLLQTACEQRGVEFIVVDAENTDFTTLPEITTKDAVYLVSRRAAGIAIEKQLLEQCPKSFYSDTLTALGYSATNQTAFFAFANVSIPQTIMHMTKDRAMLRTYVDALGGFPLVVKVLGGDHGVGVMKVDSYGGLFSLVDYLVKKKEKFTMMRYIPVSRSARLIVLGEQVIDSIEYSAPQDDFRSNEGASPNVAVKTFGPEVEELAVRAAEALGIEFGGVDILIHDETGELFVTEVNFPCFFPRCQELSGTDIAGAMVEYLLRKHSLHA